MSKSPFLTAEWRELIFANHIIDPALLAAYIPAKTELDFYNGQCYVSLVGFSFREVRVRGLKIPLHTNFPEINLRFYVRHKENNEWKRGVVFIKEIVPKPAISFIANTFFGEHYVTMPVSYKRKDGPGKFSVSYAWKFKTWNVLSVTVSEHKTPISENSGEEFITQHFRGYTSMTKNKSGEYHVDHPAWQVHPVMDYEIQCDFGNLYGKEFSFLVHEKPASIFLAEGSPVAVYSKRYI